MSKFVDIAFNLPQDRAFTYSLPPEMSVQVGVRVVAFLGRRELVGFVVRERSELPRHVVRPKAVVRVVDEAPIFDRTGIALAQWMAHIYFCSLGKALSTMSPAARRARTLTTLEEQQSQALINRPNKTPPSSERFALSEAQQQAVDTIIANPTGRFYLYGITGSGKTVVFLELAQQVLRQGGGVIYLTPEIALTQQVAAMVQARLKIEAVVMHSRLTASQRLHQWQLLQAGESQFVIGPRSAVFAPVRNLALIVIDEEHEITYKSDSSPRYHARQVAMRRCAVERARLVMGSATPSVESWAFIRRNWLQMLQLSERIRGEVPKIRVVSMQNVAGLFSPPLEDAIRRVKQAGDQSILFLNRRGYASFFNCRSCGEYLQCRRCAVTMTYHRERNILICHYCGARQSPITICPHCGSLDVRYSLPGTERIEEEIGQRFPEIRLCRIDSDTVRKRTALEERLIAFRSGRFDVLLGTQMIAKGLNFPRVQLVGIIQADTGLSVPDFRSHERVFSLITQIAGRAGRSLSNSEVIVQTWRPDNPAICRAVSGQVERFYDEEMAIRQALDFPPYARLFRLVFRGRDAGRVEAVINDFTRQYRHDLRHSADILGPCECSIALLSHNYRHQLLLRTHHFDDTHQRLQQALAAFRPPSDIYVEIDVDPMQML